MPEAIFINSDGESIDLGEYAGRDYIEVKKDIEGTSKKVKYLYNDHIYRKDRPKYPWAKEMAESFSLHLLGSGGLALLGAYFFFKAKGVAGSAFPLIEAAAAIAGAVFTILNILAKDNSAYEEMELCSMEPKEVYEEKAGRFHLIFGNLVNREGNVLVIEPSKKGDVTRIEESINLYYPLYSIAQEIGRRVALFIPVTKTMAEEEVRIYTDKILQIKFEKHREEIFNFIHSLFFDKTGKIMDENMKTMEFDF